MGFKDVSLRLLDNRWVARILAESLDKLGRIGPAEALLLAVRSVLRDEQ